MHGLAVKNREEADNHDTWGRAFVHLGGHIRTGTLTSSLIADFAANEPAWSKKAGKRVVGSSGGGGTPKASPRVEVFVPSSKAATSRTSSARRSPSQSRANLPSSLPNLEPPASPSPFKAGGGVSDGVAATEVEPKVDSAGAKVDNIEPQVGSVETKEPTSDEAQVDESQVDKPEAMEVDDSTSDSNVEVDELEDFDNSPASRLAALLSKRDSLVLPAGHKYVVDTDDNVSCFPERIVPASIGYEDFKDVKSRLEAECKVPEGLGED